jgi:hypothetical protein
MIVQRFEISASEGSKAAANAVAGVLEQLMCQQQHAPSDALKGADAGNVEAQTHDNKGCLGLGRCHRCAGTATPRSSCSKPVFVADARCTRRAPQQMF